MNLLNQLERLNAIGIALSNERDSNRLLEAILLGAKELTNADGGTLYTVVDDKLKFEIMQTNTLGIMLGGTTGEPVPFLPLPIYLDNGKPNINMVAACCVIEEKTINIDNAYTVEEFDFSGTRKFDKKMGYQSQSFLTVPMRNHDNEIIGVLQLINAIDKETQEVISFAEADQRLVESLASQAAIALTNHSLIDGLKNLFESFVKLIADAIDEKSPYTGGHCRRVPELTMMLADAAIKSEKGPFEDFSMTEKEIYELRIAAWLHDCGKVTTPETIMDKATKLETTFDRIHLIDQRFELLKLQRENSFLRMMSETVQLGIPMDMQSLQDDLTEINKQLDEDREFIRHANLGSEAMRPEDQLRVKKIAKHDFVNAAGERENFLTDDEVYNLTIVRGTLTPEERVIVNNHIVATINMLEALPYPKDLSRVPEYAGGHHERMDGKGYPKGLTRSEMSIPARMMGVADIFEALTAKDRPYKKAKALSETLEILGKMKLDSHVDPDVFDLFVREKLYLRYAEMFLDPEQIDEVDEDKIPGYIKFGVMSSLE